MSLLPGQILPQSAILGRVNEDGTVTIEQNWWLLLYNLTLQTLGTGSGLPADALIDLENVDIDAVATDSAASRQPLSNALLLAQHLDDLAADVAKLRKDVSNAILLAQTTGLDYVAPQSTGTLPQIANDTVLGNVSGSTASPSALSQAQLTALVKTFTSALSGAVPAAPTAGQFLSAGGWTNEFTASPVLANAIPLEVVTVGGSTVALLQLFSDHNVYLDNSDTGSLIFRTAGGAVRMTIAPTGITMTGPLGVNGNSPPAQSTGWGTPTGAAVENNFAGGTASLAITSAAVAQIIAYLKAKGDFGA